MSSYRAGIALHLFFVHHLPHFVHSHLCPLDTGSGVPHLGHVMPSPADFRCVFRASFTVHRPQVGQNQYFPLLLVSSPHSGQDGPCESSIVGTTIGAELLSSRLSQGVYMLSIGNPPG